MAVSENIQEVKVVLNLTKGSQTIRGCKIDATADALSDLGNAVASLHQEALKKIVKITETVLG